MKKTLIIFCLLAMACSKEENESSNENSGNTMNSKVDINSKSKNNGPGYEQLYNKFFKTTCSTTSCHGGQKGVGGLSFDNIETSYQQLLKGSVRNFSALSANIDKRVVPGKPDKSFLFYKLSLSDKELRDRKFGRQMPFGGDGSPGPKTLAAIRAWILDGAPFKGEDFHRDFGESESDSYVQCKNQDSEGLKKCLDQEKLENGVIRIYTPKLLLRAESEEILCSALSLEIPRDMIIVGLKGKQMRGGHHAALFRAMVPDVKEKVFDCTKGEKMESFNFIGGVGGAGGAGTLLKNNLAFKIPKGAQLVIQSHYINGQKNSRYVMDYVDIVLAKETKGLTIIDPFVLVDSSFLVPKGSINHSSVKECTIHKDLKIHTVLGHTHDYGVYFSLEHFSKGQNSPTLLFQGWDGRLLRSFPDIIDFKKPYNLKKGDKLKMTCKWTNLTGHDLKWPEEMCVSLMYYSPSEGFMVCDKNKKEDSPYILGGPGDKENTKTNSSLCAHETDKGNSLGVGKHCTKNNNTCSGNKKATFCLHTFDKDANFCSFMGCKNDSDCGERAYCESQTLGSACVPKKCSPN